MPMTDIEIARNTKIKPITKVAKKLKIKQKNLELYGNYKAKLSINNLNPKGKLILVTAINPTSAGEGKTTVSIGLADGLNVIGKKVCLALREPSLGPVFGIKGGATGGGYSQIVPMEDINLHFTGDFHAITSANNLLSAMIDNHIHQGNLLDLDTEKIFHKRCIDMNDRALRLIECGLGGKTNGVPRFDGFNITSASEVMAILCLASDMDDLKRRLGDIMIGLNKSGKPVYAKDLKAQDAMAILLKDAIKPNLVQTLIGTPAIVHCGPFANIAHGCNSNNATKLAMSLADYCVTEAGFGADLGAEKFLDVKCRVSGLKPNCVVVVATIRALKLHGGADKTMLKEENIDALKKGIPNLLKHISNIKDVYKLPVVCAINQFTDDTEKEINLVKEEVEKLGVKAILSNVFGHGGQGATNLAQEVVKLCECDNSKFTFTYEDNDTIEDKIRKVATKIYGAKDVILLDKAKESLANINALKLNTYPVVIAKTQYSLSDDKNLLGRPENFVVTIRDLEIRNGAKFIVALAGDMMLMPGLSKTPAAVNMHISNDMIIEGLF